MHPIDQAIYDDAVTPELLRREAAKPLPKPGASYWGDAMRELAGQAFPWADLPDLAVSLARRQMGEAIESLQARRRAVR